MNFDYMSTLKDYVNAGDLEDPSFIDSLNLALGGSSNVASNRTQVFFDALRTFGLIEEKLDNVPNATNATNASITNNFCGFDEEDAAEKCSIRCGDSFFDPVCPQGENCYLQVESCASAQANATNSPSNSTAQQDDENSTNIDTNSTDAEILEGSENSTDTEVDTQVEFAAIMVDPTSSTALVATTNYCGTTWTDAATDCGIACPSGMDGDCPPNQFCFAEITSCASNSLAPITTNWCGKDWNDASNVCTTSCPAGLDSGKSCLFLCLYY